MVIFRGKVVNIFVIKLTIIVKLWGFNNIMELCFDHSEKWMKIEKACVPSLEEYP